MQFLRITVEDMFAYHGRSSIELGGGAAGRNITVVSGRNGSGKTSLLNAMKLLFLGINDEELRRAGLTNSQRQLTARQFAMGQPNVWFGILNRRSSEQGVRSASVSLEWRQSGSLLRLARIIDFGHAGFEERLRLEVDGVVQGADDAQAELQKVMPREFVPFFFFDGEQVQELADASSIRLTADIERLLRLTFVGTLTDKLRDIIGERRRAAYPEEVLAELTTHENEERAALANLAACERTLSDIMRDLEVMRDRVRRLDEERDQLRGGISPDERRALQGRVDACRALREDLAERISTTLPPEAPFLTNHALVTAALSSLEQALATSDGGRTELLDVLRDELPGTVRASLRRLEPPVALDRRQADQLDNEVRAYLNGLDRGGRRSPALLGSLTPRQLHELRDKYLVWRDRGADQLADHADLLRRMRALNAEERRAQEDLVNAEVASDAVRARYGDIVGELAQLGSRISDQDREGVRRDEEAKRHRERVAAARGEIERVRRRYADAVRDDAEVNLATRLVAVLGELRDGRRRDKRSAVEERLNGTIGTLLRGSHLVRSVRLDEKFSMTFYDDQGGVVPRTSISAGMRQLTATALLWALKDVSARVVPMMIDTPLGRLDRENRMLLAREYYPNAADPLILLPTNSELTPDIVDCISPHVLRTYRIENGRGDDASLVLDQDRSGASRG